MVTAVYLGGGWGLVQRVWIVIRETAQSHERW